ncbi:hypothetical protein H6F39_19235 [Anabaena sp. FACHB-1250]|uniref:type II toxin-antitoxin system Phd/YefM family antitoxin n=1 Tax=Anabaena sp. FACHB-1250 TaxID=2692770 RepID=UPI0016807C2B|nr:type II toxin-antitoxin system Phd/YefM family antitoxin [Anabaena sp. FACHB-1250]MBD2143423.1 hypothetical protein [Anabaena sp. FACHB-1250]
MPAQGVLNSKLLAVEIQEHLSDFLDSLTQGETSIVIEKAGKAIATLISYSSSRYYEVQILIIKLLWCGHLARTRCTSLKATCCIKNGNL